MTTASAGFAPPPSALSYSAAEWNRRLAPFRRSTIPASLWQLVNSLVPFFALWYLMYRSLEWGYGYTLLLAIPATGMLTRIFIIQHDCGHGSFLPSRRWCDAIGSVLGVLSLTPYQYWKREHAIHHQTSGHLDKRGHGDIDTMTIAEYQALSKFGRFRYRLYRHPVVLFLLGPVFHFAVKQRLPLVTRPHTPAARWSIWLTNAALAGITVAMASTIGLKAFLLVQLPITWLSSSLGVWLFYIQHQFEETYWRRSEEWDYKDAALLGSSWFDPGPVLRWFTGNIGFHHVHHLQSGIPNYRLAACLKAHPELTQVTRLTIRSSFACARLTLWDDERHELVSFREAARRTRAAPRPPESAAA